MDLAIRTAPTRLLVMHGSVTAAQAPSSTAVDDVPMRLKSTFGSAYVTLTGVTQSVALAVLASRVEANFERFDLANWVLTLNTFLLIVLVWNEYLIAAIAYVWTPTVADALLPFSLLALQLFVAHNVYPNERLWLAAMGAFLAVGCTAFAYGFFRASRHRDNRHVLRAIGAHQWLTMAVTGGGCLLSFAAALLYERLRLGEAREAVAFAATLVIVLTIVRSVPYWNRITAHAAGSEAPTAGTESGRRFAVPIGPRQVPVCQVRVDALRRAEARNSG